MSIKRKVKHKVTEHFAIESMGKLRVRDYILTFFLAGVWLLVSWLLVKKASPQSIYIVSLLWITTLATLCMLIVRKSGAAGLFFVLGSIFTYGINDIGVTGVTKVFVLACTGLVFEAVFLLLRLEFKNIPVDIVLGSAIAAASIPLLTALMLSSQILTNKFIPLLNIIIMSFLIGIAGGILGFFIWWHLKATKIVVKFEYG